MVKENKDLFRIVESKDYQDSFFAFRHHRSGPSKEQIDDDRKEQRKRENVLPNKTFVECWVQALQDRNLLEPKKNGVWAQIEDFE